MFVPCKEAPEMKHLPTVFALVFSLALPAAAPFALAESPPATLTVTGEGASDVAPDLATLTIGVTTTADTAANALTANSAALSVMLDRLRAAGIADRDLQTSNLSVNPQWSDYSKSSGSTTEISGYTVVNMVTVRIRQLDTLGAVLDAAVADGANTLNGLTFGLSNPRPALDAARQAAVEDARAKAELYAAAAGVGLGRIVQISEGGGYGGPAPMYDSAKSPAGSVPIAASCARKPKAAAHPRRQSPTKCVSSVLRSPMPGRS